MFVHSNMFLKDFTILENIWSVNNRKLWTRTHHYTLSSKSLQNENRKLEVFGSKCQSFVCIMWFLSRNKIDQRFLLLKRSEVNKDQTMGWFSYPSPKGKFSLLTKRTVHIHKLVLLHTCTYVYIPNILKQS